MACARHICTFECDIGHMPRIRISAFPLDGKLAHVPDLRACSSLSYPEQPYACSVPNSLGDSGEKKGRGDMAQIRTDSMTVTSASCSDRKWIRIEAVETLVVCP